MPFGDIGFTGYWDANQNLVLGTAGEKLREVRNGEVRLYKVAVGGTTPLNGINVWSRGDFAYYNGFEWSRLTGTPALPYNLTINVDGGRI